MQRAGIKSGNTVRIDAQALGTLKYIRASIEAASSLAVPGSAGIATGLTGLLAAAIASLPRFQQHWLSIWLMAAVVAVSVSSVLMARQAYAQGLTLFGTPVRKFALCFLPSLFAGAILTAVLWYRDELRMIPGVWLLLYGSALVSASAMTLRTIGILGGLFALLGMVALLLPQQLQNIALGAGFGGLNLIFGIIIGRHKRSDNRDG